MDEMQFPNDWAKFLEDYSFRDHKEYYTNGARLIPTFRVEQMMHYYLRKASDVKCGFWNKHWHDSLIGHEYEECSVCGCIISDTEKFWDCKYCPNCGAHMMVRKD
jgi:hypothetical protein